MKERWIFSQNVHHGRPSTHRLISNAAAAVPTSDQTTAEECFWRKRAARAWGRCPGLLVISYSGAAPIGGPPGGRGGQGGGVLVYWSLAPPAPHRSAGRRAAGADR